MVYAYQSERGELLGGGRGEKRNVPSQVLVTYIGQIPPKALNKHFSGIFLINSLSSLGHAAGTGFGMSSKLSTGWPDFFALWADVSQLSVTQGLQKAAVTHKRAFQRKPAHRHSHRLPGHLSVQHQKLNSLQLLLRQRTEKGVRETFTALWNNKSFACFTFPFTEQERSLAGWKKNATNHSALETGCWIFRIPTHPCALHEEMLASQSKIMNKLETLQIFY